MLILFTLIRFRILGIVLLAIIPAMALIWYSAAERKLQMSREAENNTLRLSRFLASNLERDLSEGEVLLTSVSEVLRSKRLLTGGCSQTLGGLLDDSSVYANLGLANAEGKYLCSARPSPALPGLGALEWFHKLDSAGGFYVGFDFKGGHGAEPSIVLVQPVPTGPGDGERVERRYVFAVMQLDWLNDLAENSRLPPGWAISVTNLKGDAVARYPDPEKWVGKSRQNPGTLESMPASEGTRVTLGIDGVKRLYAYAKVGPKGNLIVNVGVSSQAILAPANRALRNQLSALGMVAVLAILAAWFGADVFLLKQVRTLINATKQLATGNLGARSGLSYHSGELGELAKAFDEMAETLEWRNAQLKESEVERSDPLALIPEFVERIPEPFLLMEENLSIVACNREARELFGMTKEEFLGASFQALCPRLPVEEITPWLAADESDPSLPRVRRLRARTMLNRKTGSPVPVDVSMAKISLPQGTYALALLNRTRETGTAS